MPFTLSHAAAVLPLRRTRLIWSALVIGSFGPDFQYFFFMSYDSRSWHHYPDILRYCLPFTLAAFLLFQAFIKRPVTALLPIAVQKRMDVDHSHLPRTMVEGMWVVLSLLIGVGTHLLWDSFTHPFSWFWNHIEFLRRPMAVPTDPHGYGYMAAQMFSTVAGFVILVVAFAVWYRKAKPVYAPVLALSGRVKVLIWAEILILTVAGGLWRASVLLGAAWMHLRWEYFQIIALISSIGWFCWELLAYGLVLTIAMQRRPKEGAHS